MEYSHFKQKVYQHCISKITRRINNTKESIISIQQAAKEETKSSMGDKYETGRAMAHLELEKQQAALSNLLNIQEAFNGINPKEIHDKIKPGTLLHTSIGWIYVVSALGKIKIEDIEVMVISPIAPIITMLKSVLEGGQAKLHGKELHIHKIT